MVIKMVICFLEIMMNSRNWKGTFADFADSPPGFFLWISPRFPLLANQIDPKNGDCFEESPTLPKWQA